MTPSNHREQHLEPLPRELLRKPLDYILAEHLRQRVLCVLCEQVAEDEQFDADLVREIVGYLKSEMVVHVIDEEQDLFPLIRRRAQPDDDIEMVLGQLSGDHAAEERLASSIVEGLERALGETGRPISGELRVALKRFAQTERQHLALENATVMPLAKLRLSERDLKDLAARMAARRGILFNTV
jgi:hemerythrin-like domain-containing protein